MEGKDESSARRRWGGKLVRTENERSAGKMTGRWREDQRQRRDGRNRLDGLQPSLDGFLMGRSIDEQSLASLDRMRILIKIENIHLKNYKYKYTDTMDDGWSRK